MLLACEKAGFQPTGEFQQLNSYENRVFEIKLEQQEPIIAKFYRPGRWTKEAIQEEHDFLWELKEEGISAIAPLRFRPSQTILDFKNLFVSFSPKTKGRLPQEFLSGELKVIGRLLARVHNIGEHHLAKYRPTMNSNFAGAAKALRDIEPLLPIELRNNYLDAAEWIVESFEDGAQNFDLIRIHGDCHRGNILHNGQEFYLVDFDDFVNGPAVQDFWMLLSGDDNQSQIFEILEGYEELRHFPHEQLKLIPTLNGIRVISYAAWIAKRWSDPSFPKLFPLFNTYSYWAEESEALNRIAQLCGNFP